MSERVRDDYRVAPRVTPARRRHRPRQRPRPSWSFPLALALTVLGSLVPGIGLIAAGKRKLGVLVLSLFGLLVIGVAFVLATRRQEILHWAVQPGTLLTVGIVFPLLGIAWVSVIVGTWRAVSPREASLLERTVGSALVVGLSLAVLLPLAVGGRYAQVQKGVVEHVFAGEDSKSATRPKNVTRKDPWGGRGRVNVLLLGGDGGAGRYGVRPDSLQVASINTHTGDTVLFSLPRNLMNAPFPPGSALADVYPDGVYTGEGDDLEWMLNSIYRNVPAQHPGLLDSDNPGADATKLAVGEALGLRLDYYVLINLNGFSRLIEALGGVTVNVNRRVAIGGSSDEGIPPKGWIEPGPNKHLDGYHTLWFARGRYDSDDYERMERQRCTMKAIIDQADPGKVLTRYEAIAQSSKAIVFTDIPGALLPAFVDLSMKVKGADVTSIAFTNKIIHSYDPDYDLIRSMVGKAVQASGKASEEGDPAPGPAKTRTAAPKPTPTGDGPAPTPNPSRPADSLDDACAYAPAS